MNPKDEIVLCAGRVATLAFVRLLVLGVFGAMPATESPRLRHALAVFVLAFLFFRHVSTFQESAGGKALE